MPVRVGLKVIELWNASMEKEVCEYEKQLIEKGKIVFYGPSNFTRWSEKHNHIPLEEAIVGKSGEKCCVNRGFGSSCTEHHLYYYHRMIKPLEPKVLVYSSFGNGENFGYTLEEEWELAQRVALYTLADFPDVHIYLCAPNRRRDITDARLEKLAKYDEYLKEFAKNTPNCFFISAREYEPLQRNDIYVSDGIHFNQDGYHLYADFFREALKDELERF